MRALDGIGVVFVNTMVNRGIVNGVANLTFGTYLFTPGDKDQIDPDLVISARLRMDETCLRNVHAELGQLIALIDKAKAKVLPVTHMNGAPTSDDDVQEPAAGVAAKPN